ncbi:MAG: hypothetical protein ABWX67_16605 [Allosphingosinicella sp.]
MAADLEQQDQPSTGTERETWQAPQVIRFATAGAGGGDTVSSADGETSKS